MRAILLCVITCFINVMAGAQTFTLYFDFNSFILNNESRNILDNFIAKGKLKSIGFFGHTDQMGSIEYNDWLSVQRALAVKDYLISKGLPQSEVSVVRGFGADRLISDRQDETSRQLNRRVSISSFYKATATDLAIAAKQLPTYYTPSPNLKPGVQPTIETIAKIATEKPGVKDQSTVLKETAPTVKVKTTVDAEKKTVAESSPANKAKMDSSEGTSTKTKEENSFANRLSKTVNKPVSSPVKPTVKVVKAPVVKQQKSDRLIDDIQDKTTKEGEHIILKNIYFQGGRHTFLAKSYSALDDLLETMQKVPTLVVEIQGHVCCHEGDGDEIDFDTGEPVLSVTRAKAVYDFLLENGIDKKRINYKGLAHKFPIIAVEKSEEDAETNRRVEIKIIKK